MAKWIKDLEDKAKDDYIHHKCSNCGELAFYESIYEDDYDEGIDGEWVNLGQIMTGITEHITKYCPNCGEKMECDDAIKEIYGCKACIGYNENNFYSNRCSDCGWYIWGDDNNPDKWELNKEFKI